METYIPLVQNPLLQRDVVAETNPQQKQYNDPNQKSNKRFYDIHRIRVISSKLSSVGYDATLLILQVAFTKGGIYQYYKVPSHVYSAFIMNSNKDQYFKKYIENRFRRELVK